ncbi:MAG: Fis family transcriptional regulator [Bacteroidetes bacterium GWF2_41_61]|jgi:DNA-binding NtrC family response regulator|nr:MAG: Fis family transcriptional regulator [Bacteroidetes bacterium GWE2_40_15]OFY31794.1 MAG: Fis family transcriptional regulator [Bacteroidetes bacterium GWF2_41_61]OFY89422.1 MAG: Fis family transcriptional regulator [Bacteroidetes bacterium RIFOXYA12_FULL_40_10]PKP05845.1 MAG: response regulator [Bacteroidetes bacterium HGW-Bacteroidetes-5]HBG25015.1 response regulator [Rikenellaceae bacterium]
MKLLIIDDEKSIRNTLKEILEFEGHSVSLASDGVEGLALATSDSFDVIFSDIKMPNMDGMELLDRLNEANVDSSVIMISGHGSIESAVDCIKKGAFDFIQKPLDLNRILITLRNATDRTNLVKETKTLKKRVAKIPEIVGVSSAITRIKDMIERVAPTEARVLITGSNGTGKELVARWLHEKSSRCSMPFVEVNCAAIPGELIESELFGHEKGAFTSAVKQHKGKFEQADGGTLFLDEIGDMSLAAQAKVLRVLQENRISRVGSDKDISVKVRVIAATNKNLNEEIEKGTFREDLYHRLSVIVIHVPPLSERREDIPLLTKHFLEQISQESGLPPRKIDDSALQELSLYKWTGNIRELRNVVERLMILSNNVITKEDVVDYAKPIFR